MFEMAIEREVIFESGPLHLAGTLMLPYSEGQFPGVVLIPGSGQVDRNENSKKLSINAFREIANYLLGEGIASLRYDKRGVGESEGDFWKAGFYDNVSDAFSALNFLKSQDGIQSDKVFLLGHSEGALISTRLAGTGADVAGAILLAGAAQSGEDILLWQGEQVTKGMKGFNKWLIDHLHIDVQKAQHKQLEKIKNSTKDWYRVQLIAKLNARWMREFLSYDPTEDLSKIRVPVLAITGTKDIQVNPDDLGRMAQLVKSDFEWHKVENLTHILRIELGQPTLSTYKEQIRHPIDERILQIISDWFRRHLQQQRPEPYPTRQMVGKKTGSL
jgi:pimeloyl-ACP methyl ester carboxylesterase